MRLLHPLYHLHYLHHLPAEATLEAPQQRCLVLREGVGNPVRWRWTMVMTDLTSVLATSRMP